jgi:hypothetical protein
MSGTTDKKKKTANDRRGTAWLVFHEMISFLLFIISDTQEKDS